MKNNKLKIEITEKIINQESESKFLNLIDSNEEIIILSPHLDDAVLSMGALTSHLVNKKKKIEVYTIFTKSSGIKTKSIQIILDRAGYEDSGIYFETRRKEDSNAWKSLGIEKINHLDFVDAAWRIEKEEPVYPTNQIAEIAACDKQLIEDVEKSIREIIKSKKNSIIFAPLAVGGHVDHQITNIIAKRLNENIIFYVDFPYSLKWSQSNHDYELENKELFEWGKGLREKRNAILEYRSQLPSFIPFSKNGILTLTSEKYFIPKIS